VDAWDLLDQAGIPSQQHLVSAIGVSNLEISPEKPHLLAAGDRDGGLHLLQLPRSLVKPIIDEEQLMERFLNQELLRIEYYIGKFNEAENHTNGQREEAMEETFGERFGREEGKPGVPGRSEEEVLEEGFDAFMEENMQKFRAVTESISTSINQD